MPADQIQLNAGVGGDVLAAKEIAGIHFQRGLLATPDGVDVALANRLPVASKLVDPAEADVTAANPLPVINEEPAATTSDGTAESTGVEATVLPAGGPGVSLDVKAIVITANGNADWILRDSAAGSTKWKGHVNQSGPIVISFDGVTLRQTAPNTAWTIQRAGGGGTSIECSLVAVQRT